MDDPNLFNNDNVSDDEDDEGTIVISNQSILKWMSEKKELTSIVASDSLQIVLPFPSARLVRARSMLTKSCDVLNLFDFVNIDLDHRLSIETQYVLWGEPSTYRRSDVTVNLMPTRKEHHILPKKFAIIAGRYVQLNATINKRTTCRCYFEFSLLALSGDGQLLDYATTSGFAEKFSDFSGMIIHHDIGLVLYYANANDDFDLFMKFKHSPIHHALSRVARVVRLDKFTSSLTPRVGVQSISVCPYKSERCSFCAALKHAFLVFRDHDLSKKLTLGSGDREDERKIVELPDTSGGGRLLRREFLRSPFHNRRPRPRRNHGRVGKIVSIMRKQIK